MTPLEVVDTAVKIGLGALITGVAAFLVARGNRSHELRKEHLKRRQDSLEVISDAFEQCHSVFLVNCHHGIPPELSLPDLQPKTVKDVYPERYKSTKEAILRLHQLEGRLLLLV